MSSPLDILLAQPGQTTQAGPDPTDTWRALAMQPPSTLERAGTAFGEGLGHSIFAPAARALMAPGVSALEQRPTAPGSVFAPPAQPQPSTRERIAAYDEAQARAGFEKPGLDIAAEGFAGMAGMLAGDLPTFFMPGTAIARSIGLGRTVAKGLAASGSTQALIRSMVDTGALFGVGEAMRESVHQAFDPGVEFDPWKIVGEAAKGTATGAALGATHLLPNRLLQTAGEYAVFGGVSPALEGRLPTREDLWGAAAAVLGFRALDLVMKGSQPNADPAVVGEITRKLEAAKLAESEGLPPPISAGAKSIEGAFRTLFIERDANVTDLEAQVAGKLARAEFIETATKDPEYLQKFSPEAVQLAQQRFLREFSETRQAEAEMSRFLEEQYPQGRPAAPGGRQVVEMRGEPAERLPLETFRIARPETQVSEDVIRRQPGIGGTRTEALSEATAAKLPERVAEGPAPIKPKPPAATPPPAGPAAAGEKTIEAATEGPAAPPMPQALRPPTEEQLVRARVHINQLVPKEFRGDMRKLLTQIQGDLETGRPIDQAILSHETVAKVLAAGGWKAEPFVGELEAPKAALPRTPQEAGYQAAVELRNGNVLRAEPGKSIAQVMRDASVLPSQVARFGYAHPQHGFRPGREVVSEIVKSLGAAHGMKAEQLAARVAEAETKRAERMVLEDLTAGTPTTGEAPSLATGPAPTVEKHTMPAWEAEMKARRGDLKKSAGEPPSARPGVLPLPDPEAYTGPLGQERYREALERSRQVSDEIAHQLHESAWKARYLVARERFRTTGDPGKATGPTYSSNWEVLAGGQGKHLSESVLREIEKVQAGAAFRVVKRGVKVETPLDFAALGQLFARNDAFEVFGTAYFAKDGTLLHVELTSARMPSSVPPYAISEEGIARYEEAKEQSPEAAQKVLEEMYNDEFKRIRARMGELKADHFANFHNHPSSAAAPSTADVSVAKSFEYYMPEWKYHVVFDQGHFGLMSRESMDPRVVPLPPEVTRTGRILGVPEVYHEILGMKFEDPEVAALVADQFNSGDASALIFYRDGFNRLTGVQRVPASTLQRIGYADEHSETFIRKLDNEVTRQGLRRFHAEDAVVFYDGKLDAVSAGMIQAVERGIFKSAVSRYTDSEGNVVGYEEMATPWEPKSFQDRYTGDRVPPAEAILRKHKIDQSGTGAFALEMRERKAREEYKAEEVDPQPRRVPPPPKRPKLPGDNPRGRGVPIEAGTKFAGQYESDYATGGRALRERLLDIIGEQQEWQRRGTMSRAQITKLAEGEHIRAKDIDHLLGKQGTILPVEYQEAFITEYYRLDKRLETLSGEAINAGNAGNLNKKLEAEREIEAVTDQMVKLWMVVQASSSEAGRALGARAKQPGFMRSYASTLRTILDERRLSPEQQKRLIENIVKARTPEARRAAIDEAHIPDLWDKFFELRNGMLLSSPVTLLERNPGGNTAAVVTRFAENVAGIPFDLLFDAAGIGKPTEGRRTPAEAAWDLYGMWQGLKMGSQQFVKALTDESYAISRGGRLQEAGITGSIKPDLPGTGLSRFPRINKMQGPIGKIARAPFRMLAGTDMLYASVNRTGEAYRRAAREATLEGVQGVDRTARINELAEAALGVDYQRLGALLEDISLAESAVERIAAQAEGSAKEFIFQKELGTQAKRLDALRFATVVNPVTGRPHKTNMAKFLRFFVPFLPTPINILKFTTERAPILALTTERNRAFWEMFKDPKNVPREQLVDAYARMAVGLAIFTPFVMWALEGNITGQGPDNPGAAALWKRFNQANSVRIDGRWYSYRGLSPLSEVMAAAAEVAKAYPEPITVESAMKIGLAISSTFLDQPFLTGVNDVLTALTDRREGERRAVTAIGSAASSVLTPRLLTFAARSGDPDQRAFPDTVYERIMQDSPASRGGTVPYRDPLGRKMSAENMTHQLTNAWLMTKESASRSKADHLLWLASDMPHQAVVNYPSRRQLGRRLTAEEYDRFLAKRGEILEPMLERAGSNPGVLAMARRNKPAIQKYIRSLTEEATLVAKVRTVIPGELSRLNLEDTQQNRMRLYFIAKTAALRDMYESADATDEDKLYMIATGRPAPGSALYAPEVAGDVSVE